LDIILDVSRLLSCMRRATPFGIDRVDGPGGALDGTSGAECNFIAQDPWGWFGTIPRGTATTLLDTLEETRALGGSPPKPLHRARQITATVQAGLAGARKVAPSTTLAAYRRSVSLLVSHRLLEREAPICALRRAGPHRPTAEAAGALALPLHRLRPRRYVVS
jgi:hypothetical protein